MFILLNFGVHYFQLTSVVGPGSDIDGKPHEIVNLDVAVAEMPGSILALARKSNEPKPTAPCGKSIPITLRNKTLASLAGTMRRRGM